jgi:hypothetical protein
MDHEGGETEEAAMPLPAEPPPGSGTQPGKSVPKQMESAEERSFRIQADSTAQNLSGSSSKNDLVPNFKVKMNLVFNVQETARRNSQVHIPTAPRRLMPERFERT